MGAQGMGGQGAVGGPHRGVQHPATSVLAVGCMALIQCIGYEIPCTDPAYWPRGVRY